MTRGCEGLLLKKRVPGAKIRVLFTLHQTAQNLIEDASIFDALWFPELFPSHPSFWQKAFFYRMIDSVVATSLWRIVVETLAHLTKMRPRVGFKQGVSGCRDRLMTCLTTWLLEGWFHLSADVRSGCDGQKVGPPYPGSHCVVTALCLSTDRKATAAASAATTQNQLAPATDPGQRSAFQRPPTYSPSFLRLT